MQHVCLQLLLALSLLIMNDSTKSIFERMWSIIIGICLSPFLFIVLIISPIFWILFGKSLVYITTKFLVKHSKSFKILMDI